MTLSQDTGLKSPWITIWFSPRRTIDTILATRPRHLVWPLASLGAIASFHGQLLSFGIASPLLDWGGFFGLIVASTAFGIAWLYLSAIIFNWIGKLFGGRASTLELRAVLAWSAVPTILGFIVLLPISASPDGATAILRGGIALLVAAFGFWSLVIFLLMLARVQHFGFWRTIATYLLDLVFLFAVAIVVRAFLYQPFNTPSGAMAPTLLNGDYFFVSKYAYGYGNYSLPFSPRVFSGRILGSEPTRGDVAVFRLPKDSTVDYVKRVVGLPGDRIQMKQGLLYINDVPVARERRSDFTGADVCGVGSVANVKRWRETLPNGSSYETLDCVDNGFYDNTNVYTVPDGRFFALGDNRDNSSDSRLLSAFGYVPFENLVGRVGLIFFSRTTGTGGVNSTRPERIGLIVR